MKNKNNKCSVNIWKETYSEREKVFRIDNSWHVVCRSTLNASSLLVFQQSDSAHRSKF